MIDIYDSLTWDRKILNYLWVVLVLSFVVPLINMPYVLSQDFLIKDFLIERVLIPSFINLIIMLNLEYFFKKHNKKSYFLLILSVVAMANILMCVHQEVRYAMLPMYMIPIFLSVFTLDVLKIKFAFTVTFLSVFIINYYTNILEFDIVSFISFLAILSSAYFLGIKLTIRYKELNENLASSIKNEQELFYKNIYMERLSKVDLSTDLYNHKTFHEYLEKLLNQYKEDEFELHLALLDLDKFKDVNDTYGHSIGDCVIKGTSQVLLENTDSNDFVARYGGEEFAIIFTEKNKSKAIERTEKIRKKVEEKVYIEMDYKSVTLSIGFASANGNISKDELFDLADSRLYCAKHLGRNQVVFTGKKEEA